MFLPSGGFLKPNFEWSDQKVPVLVVFAYLGIHCLKLCQAPAVGATVVGATVLGAPVVGATVVGAPVVGATVAGLQDPRQMKFSPCFWPIA